MGNANTYTIQHAIKKAIEHKGRILNAIEGFINTKTKIKCECGVCGHIWESTFSNLWYHNKWCAVCANVHKYSVEDMHQLAKKNGGWKFMSDKYENNHTKYEWLCPAGLHAYKRQYAVFKKIKICRECDREMKLTTAKEIIKQRNGKILSTKYEGSRMRIFMSCNNHEPFEITVSHIIAGRWCKKCHVNYAEELCRFIFQHLTGELFINTRQALVELELDGYCEKLKIAFEYNGRQHYEHTISFHKTQNDFKAQQKRDKDKRELCASRGLKLIEIPYTESDNLLELAKYIHIKLQENNTPIIQTVEKIPFKDFAPSKARLNEYRKIAKNGGSELLSKVYMGGNVLHLFKCNVHLKEWQGTPYNVKHQNAKCPICMGENYSTAMALRNKARAKGVIKITDLITGKKFAFENLEDDKINEHFSHNTIRRALNSNGIIQVKKTHSKYKHPCFVERLPKSGNEQDTLAIDKWIKEQLPKSRLNEFREIKQMYLHDMETVKQLKCPHCKSGKHVKGGLSSGSQRYICINCGRSFANKSSLGKVV